MIPKFLLTISFILTVMGFFSQYALIFDAASHFRLQYFVLQMVCILLCVFQKHWRLLALTTLVAIMNIWLILPFYLPNQSSIKESSPTLKVLFINLNSSNQNYQKTLDYIHSVKPDILGLAEINQGWVEVLHDLREEFPFYKEIARQDNFGMGLYSRWPLSSMQLKYYSDVDVPSIIADFSFEGKPTTILLTHPVPPVRKDYYDWRNQQLQNIVLDRSTMNKRLIVLGDLNTASWSHHFQSFITGMGLKDTRLGFGLQITWPTWNPLLITTVDHCLVSDHWHVHDHQIGPHIGSDHWPVFVELMLVD